MQKIRRTLVSVTANHRQPTHSPCLNHHQLRLQFISSVSTYIYLCNQINRFIPGFSLRRRLDKRLRFTVRASVSLFLSSISSSLRRISFSLHRKWESAFRSTSVRPVFRSEMLAGSFTVSSTVSRYSSYTWSLSMYAICWLVGSVNFSWDLWFTNLILVRSGLIVFWCRNLVDFSSDLHLFVNLIRISCSVVWFSFRSVLFITVILIMRG